MSDKNNIVDPIPDEFSSYEEAAEFWDTHDTIDYLDASLVVNTTSELRSRHEEIELDPQIARDLRAEAKRKGIKPSHLANTLLRQQLTASE